MRAVETLESIRDVCEVEFVSAPRGAETGSGSPHPSVLIEVPHGATRRRHYEATRSLLTGDLPEDLEEFFFVNTDVGSIECARSIARMLVEPGAFSELQDLVDENGIAKRRVEQVLIVRGLLARTFVDLNRVIAPDQSNGSDGRGAGGGTMTPGFPAYVTSAEDRETLRRLHKAYQSVASTAYELVLSDAGAAVPSYALALHTYAPRSVAIDQIDGNIVAALRRAYEPDRYETFPRRPDVDLITSEAERGPEVESDARLAPEALVRAVRANYRRIGIEATENATYRLHEATMGHVHSKRHPGRVLCLEVNREQLVETFTPFAEMSVDDLKARRMAAPIAAAILTDESRATENPAR